MPALLLFAQAHPSNLVAARLQMAFTLGFHIVLACFGVGIPVLVLLAEGMYLRTRDEGWRTLARRWSKVFAVLFAVGAVSGTVLSFELGLLWPEFMARFGSVIGLPFTLEGFAFFVEAIFVGISIYGWKRLSPRAHWWSGVPIAVSGLASAWFVVTANAWMNAPRGFRLVDGAVVDVDPLAAMMNPATWAQTTHMIIAAYMVSGFVVASVYAVALLGGRATLHHRRAFTLALLPAAALAPLQLAAGHWSAHVVSLTQPVKLAAMEGQFRTEKGAPLRIGGIPDESRRETRYAIEIHGGLSWLAYGDRQATVRGLDDFPREDTPPVRVVHLAFQLMVAAGMLLLLVSLTTGWSLWRHRRIPSGRWFLMAVASCGPAAVLALEAGWTVTEVGRQPWIVQGVLRTADAVTDAPGVSWVLAATLAIYGVLAIGTLGVLRLLARVPLPEAADAD
jgi:cytochrome bd ubiquinol oxidase subunit I